jgi:hypothetical protein
MIGQTFRIFGQLVNTKTSSGAPGLRVEAWDKYQNLLGAATSDPEGRFEISFREAYPEYYEVEQPLGSDDVQFARPPGSEDYPPSPSPISEGYPPKRLSYLFFRVFRDNTIVKSVENVVDWNATTGGTNVVIEVDVPSGSSGSSEVALHELGESIAVSVVSIQQELARYPNTLGALYVDDLEMDIPLSLRVNDVGQVMATVADHETPDLATGKLHLRLRPVLGASQPLPVISGQSLAALGALSPQAIARLEAERIFSVDDLLRVSRNASGRAALEKLNLGTEVDTLLDRTAVLTLPTLPVPVAESLLQVGVESPDGFVQGDPVTLAESLSERLKQPISAEDVASWQQEAGEAIALPLPSHRPAEDQ